VSEGNSIVRRNPVVIAVIFAVALVILVVARSYMAPYNTCVRGLIDSGVSDRIALIRCKGA